MCSVKRMKFVAKRVFDLGLSVAALVVLAPLMVLVAGGVAIKLGRPILFKQVRPGLDGKPFVMLKFRTMTDLHGSNGMLLPDSERLTSFGRFLRSTSLDELPEIINVVLGQMSMVGPRPLLMEYIGRYSLDQARRHEVKPGITGWAQVNGRNALSWEHKFALDVWYVDHWNLWLDVRILWMTVAGVLSRSGVSAPGHETMPVFMGSRPSGGAE